MRRVYLINLSFGLAGIERRFANLWRVLRRRGRVWPILVIPSTHALQLHAAGLLPDEPESVVIVHEPKPLSVMGRFRLPPVFHTPRDLIRSRTISLGYWRFWPKIAS